MPNPLLIPDDGIVDDVAIELAVRGRRPVALTRLERSVAAALILATGGSTGDLCQRLRVSKPTACRLARQARRLQEIAGDAERVFPRAQRPPVTIPAAS